VYHYGPGELPQNVITAIDDFYDAHMRSVMRKIDSSFEAELAAARRKSLTLMQ
jgi:hypothetical protein